MKSTINEIKIQILPVLRQAGVTRSSIFGSYARGEETKDSDLDLLVELPDDLSLFDVIDLKHKLEDKIGKSVDLVEYHLIKRFDQEICLKRSSSNFIMRDPEAYLTDIIESISLIDEYVASLTKERFNKDQKIKNAVLRRLEIIGEAVKQLPKKVKEENPEVAWRRIAGLRDVLSHEYFGIEIDRIWKIIQKDLPKLKKQIQKIIIPN